jgi:xanthine dehydrogenase YagR molybdenum-binding subunit
MAVDAGADGESLEINDGHSELRAVTVPAGVPTHIQHEDQRNIPETGASPLLPGEEPEYTGQPDEQRDSYQKVTGQAKYTSDVQLPGMQYARLANATIPHAGIASMDVSVAQKYPGVTSNHRIHAGYLLDVAVVRDAAQETPSEWPVVRYAGQPVVAVAAVSPEIAADAARLVTVNYEPLPFVVEMEAARQPSAPQVFPGAVRPAFVRGSTVPPDAVAQAGNVRGPVTHSRGDVEDGFRNADVVLEGRFCTPLQSYSALEPHAVIVDWKADGMTIRASTQGTATVREEFATFFELSLSQVRVIAEYAGGEFGGNPRAGNAGVCAAAVSKKSAAPVSLVLNRKEEHLATGNIASSSQVLRIGAKKDGTITVLRLVSYGSAGCGTGAGCAGPAISMYSCDSLHAEEYDVFTNTGPASVAPPAGYLQGIFALEQMMDELAEGLKIDPLDLRDRVDPNSLRRAERKKVRESRLWKSRNAVHGSGTGVIWRGVGVAQASWPGVVESSAVESDGGVIAVEIEVDMETGRIHVRRVLAVIHCERAINSLQIESRIHGGVLRGISQTLFEQRLFDPATGFMINADLERYKIAGVREMPDIEVELIQSSTGQSPTDASGISGSAGQIIVGAAIANAFYNAIGKRMRRTPMTPLQVLSLCCDETPRTVTA